LWIKETILALGLLVPGGRLPSLLERSLRAVGKHEHGNGGFDESYERVGVKSEVLTRGPIVGPQPAAVVPGMMLFFASWWGADTMESITCMKNQKEVLV
jgi:hypothetical protein